MKSFLSFRLGHLLALSALLAPSFAFAQGNTVTINLTAGVLNDSTGHALPDGDLVLLVADTGTNGFGPLSPGSSLTAGSFLNGEDQIIGVTSTGTAGAGGAFDSFASIPVGTSPSLAVGNALAVIWVTSSGTVLNSGESYGLFTGTSPSDGDPWLVPALGDTIDINFETTPIGTHDDSEGDADLTAVPEPATYSLIAGALALIAGVVHTRHSRKRALPSV